jgi:hypothetical protein
MYKHTRRHIPEYCENLILCRSTNSLARHPKFWILNLCGVKCLCSYKPVLCFLADRIFLNTPAISVHFTQNPVFRKFRSSSLSQDSVFLALDNDITHKMGIDFPSTLLFRRRILTFQRLAASRISTEIFSSYCAINALQQVDVEQGNSSHLIWETHKIHKCALLVEGRFCNIKQNGTCSIIYHDAVRTRQLGL